MGPRHVGIEEELLLVDPADGRPLAMSSAVLREVPTEESAEVTGELAREQIETATRPCLCLDELGAEVRRWRRAAATAAAAAGAHVAALATSPLPAHPSIAPDSRYRAMAERFGIVAQEQLTCGCHIHVEIDSDEEGVAVLDRIRGWLPPLLALSANSPFWQGSDSGYASYRSQVWGRWPSAGPTELFGSAATYHATIKSMISSATLLDEGMVYFDARLSHQHPTLEIRVADVCLHPDDAVLLAALTRALVDTAARAWRAGEPPIPLRVELLRLAAWRAARSALEGDLLDPSGRPAPAQQVVQSLIDHVKPALQDLDELDIVDELLTTLLRRGNGATAQHRVGRSSRQLADVVAYAVERTTAE